VNRRRCTRSSLDPRSEVLDDSVTTSARGIAYLFHVRMIVRVDFFGESARFFLGIAKTTGTLGTPLLVLHTGHHPSTARNSIPG
jgi:hypothetical protein